MKIRHDFVTNSSSSSFVIAKQLLTGEQLASLLGFNDISRQRYHSIANKQKMDLAAEDSSDNPEAWMGLWDEIWCGDLWSVNTDDNYVTGWTSMDNGDMQKFMKEIGIEEKLVIFNNEG